MRTERDLRSLLGRIDGRGYPAYKDIRGAYSFEDFELFVDHVQGDPFAAPSRMRLRLDMKVAGFPVSTRELPIRRLALRDFLARCFSAGCEGVRGKLGSGKSGLIAMDRPGQEILERSSIVVSDTFVEARFVVGLPAQGRRVLGRQAVALLCEKLPLLVRDCLSYAQLDHRTLERHLDVAEDADALRRWLPSKGLVAFVADGAVLPRRSGVDQRAMGGADVLPFKGPESLRVEVDLPHAGKVTGMGIAAGVTLIVGGGYHGKSTLLSAVERGVYNHVPDDGRELVVSEPSAVKIRAEDGRRVEGVDLRPFINHLPGSSDPSSFRTDNASGSTSQAANIIEALEVGVSTLLLDEDTCATNLMIRDARMQDLVEKNGEPITPFVDRIRQLSDRGISSILVLGGSGDYFDVADRVIRMDNYIPREVTEEAKRIANEKPTGRKVESDSVWPEADVKRRPIASSIDPSRGRRDVSIKSRELKVVVFGEEEIDVSLIGQLVDEGQVRAIGKAIDLARREFMTDDRGGLQEVIEGVMERLSDEGLDALDSRVSGELVAFRAYELAATINRLRSLKVRGG